MSENTVDQLIAVDSKRIAELGRKTNIYLTILRPKERKSEEQNGLGEEGRAEGGGGGQKDVRRGEKDSAEHFEHEREGEQTVGGRGDGPDEGEGREEVLGQLYISEGPLSLLIFLDPPAQRRF